MRAPVYRNIEAQNTFAGLAFPTEVIVVLATFWVAIAVSTPGLALLSTLGAYAGIRIVGYGKAPLFLQHWLAFTARRFAAAGVLSAAARAPAPRFPFAPYLCRDAPRAARHLTFV
jgi:hypothetical protein